jgi:hypothetical protein
MGISVLVGSPADFGKLIAAETEKWGKVVKFANIKPEKGRRAPGRSGRACACYSSITSSVLLKKRLS